MNTDMKTDIINETFREQEARIAQLEQELDRTRAALVKCAQGCYEAATGRKREDGNIVLDVQYVIDHVEALNLREVEQRARAERVEAEADYLNRLVIKARTNRDAALAANAEMRAALEGLYAYAFETRPVYVSREGIDALLGKAGGR